MVATIDHAERAKRIGASDVPAILGCSPHRTMHTVWLEKTERIEPDKGGEAARLGNRLEVAILDEAESDLGDLERDVRVWREDVDFPLAATLDGRVVATGDVVQAKTSGMTGPVYGHWGPAGTDEIPEGYVAQTLVEQFCAQAWVSHVYALLGGRGMVPYRVRSESALLKAIVQGLRSFWLDYVEPDVEPPRDAEPSIEVAKRLKREPKKLITADEGDDVIRLTRRARRLRNMKSRVEKLSKQADAALLLELGDAEAVDLPSGHRVTNYTQSRTTKPVLEPRTSYFPVLRIPKGVIQ
ncbi:MAG: YqaJ viral recombinase family protein [Planctomycetota bacterium]